MAGGATSVGQQATKLFGGGFGVFGGKGPMSSLAGLNMPFGNGDKATGAPATATTTSSNKGEARLIPDGGYGTATNWGRSQTIYNVQVRWRIHNCGPPVRCHEADVRFASTYMAVLFWVQTQVFHPETVDDVKRLILQAKQEGRTLRPVGHTHSWSPILADNNNMVLVFDKMLGV